MYEGLVSRIGNMRPIKGADFIVQADVLINGTVITSVVTSKNTPDQTLGIYFCADIQLSEEYCKANNLLVLRDEQENKIPGSGYLDPDKRRITAQRFKGVKSDGLWMPATSLDYIHDNSKVPSQSLKEGDKIADYMRSDAVLFPITRRYPKPETFTSMSKSGKVQRELESFPRHYDTDQLMHNLEEFKHALEHNTHVYITEKCHGSSHRVGNVLVPIELKWYQKIVNKLFKNHFKDSKYQIVHGTRNVVLNEDTTGYYGSNQFRYDAVGNPDIPVNTILYGEIVGYIGERPIMPVHSTKDVPEYKKRYGDTITYHYGQEVNTARFYVYRVIQDGRIYLFPNLLHYLSN